MLEYLHDLQRTFTTLSGEFVRLIVLSERAGPTLSAQESEKIREAAILVGDALVEVSALLVPAALRMGLDDTAVRLARSTKQMESALNRLRS